MGSISTGGTCFNKMNIFEGKNFEVGYWTNNSLVNPGNFWDENLMPQDHSWTEAPFGYSVQNLEILDTTAEEDINIQNILIRMLDSIPQIRNSLQDSMQQLENDMQKIMQEMNSSFAILNEKLSKWESQNSAPKVVVQEKSEHSCAAKPKEAHNDSRSNSSLPSKIHDQKVVNQEKGPRGNFSQDYMSNSQTQMNFPQGQELNPQGQKQSTWNTHEEQSIPQAQTPFS